MHRCLLNLKTKNGVELYDSVIRDRQEAARTPEGLCSFVNDMQIKAAKFDLAVVNYLTEHEQEMSENTDNQAWREYREMYEKYRVFKFFSGTAT